jgi:hypothetical protein
MYDRGNDAKEMERDIQKEKDQKRKSEVDRGEMRARVWRGGFLG